MPRNLARLAVIAVVSSLLLFLPAPAHAETRISGKIPDGFVFTKSQSPYRITDTLMVDMGSTVRVEAGVTLFTPKNKPAFWSLGSIILEGTAAEKIRVIGAHSPATPGVFVRAENAPSHGLLKVTHTTFDSVGKLIEGRYSIEISVTDSDLYMTTVYARFPASFVMERNVFLDHSGIEIAYIAMIRSDSTPPVIRNNLFVGIPGVRPLYRPRTERYWINVFEGKGYAVEIRGNTLLPSRGFALNASYAGELDASGNFWGTTNADEIQRLVLDKSDSFQWTTFVKSDSPLIAPDPATPTKARFTPGARTAVLAKFAGRSSRLSFSQEQQISKFTATLPEVGHVVCATTYLASKDKALALRQASNACSTFTAGYIAGASGSFTTRAIAVKTSKRSLNLITTLTLGR